MNRSHRARIARALGLVLAAASFGCGPAPIVVPPPPPPPPEPPSLVLIPVKLPEAAPEDPSFRAKPPPSGQDAPFVAPKITESRLSNGIRVLMVARHEMPIVSLGVVVDRGGAEQGKPGLASMLASMLLAGTKTRSALALSEELDSLGASYSSFADFDSLGVTAQVLTEKLPRLVPILADIVQNPAFDAAELDRERKKRLTTIAAQADSPGTQMVYLMNEKLYPSERHPYHFPLIGNKASVEGVQASDLGRLHLELFKQGQITIAIAGDIDETATVALLEKAFGAWKVPSPAAQIKPPKDLPSPGLGEKRIVHVIDRPGAAQSNLVVALVGIARKNPDYDALMVMNTMLGGQFSSRLNMNLREKHAYTYGAYSRFDTRHGAGPFSAGGAMMTAATAPAIREIFAEIDRIRKEPPSAEELADAKANLVRQLPARFETAGETSGTLARLAVMGLPLDEPATRPERIRKVTAEDVKRVAEKYLRPEQMRIVVVGDASVIEKDLGALGRGELDIKRAAKKEEKKEKKPEPRKPEPAKTKKPTPTPPPVDPFRSRH